MSLQLPNRNWWKQIPLSELQIIEYTRRANHTNVPLEAFFVRYFHEFLQ